MPRLPLLSGSRLPLVTVADDAVLLRPPPRARPAARRRGRGRRGASLPARRARRSRDLVTRGGRVDDRRRATLAARPRARPSTRASRRSRPSIDELERLGMPAEQHTILVAGGLERRAGRRELERVLRPTEARDFRGTVVVHDAESPELRPLELDGRPRGARPPRAARDRPRRLRHGRRDVRARRRGGAARRVRGRGRSRRSRRRRPCSRRRSRRPARSPAGSQPRWPAHGRDGRLARARPPAPDRPLPRLPVARRRRRGARAARRCAGSRTCCPARCAARLLQRLGARATPSRVLAGPPAVAHAEALLRGVSLRGVPLAAQLDTIVVPLPWAVAPRPARAAEPDHRRGDRARPRAAPLARRLAARRGRDDRPPPRPPAHVRARPAGAVPRPLPRAPRRSRRRTQLAAARARRRRRRRARSPPTGRGARRIRCCPTSTGPRAPRRSRARAACSSPAAATPARPARSGSSRPTASATALEMARGVAGGSHRLGVLLAPPYAPLIVA